MRAVLAKVELGWQCSENAERMHTRYCENPPQAIGLFDFRCKISFLAYLRNGNNNLNVSIDKSCERINIQKDLPCPFVLLPVACRGKQNKYPMFVLNPLPPEVFGSFSGFKGIFIFHHQPLQRGALPLLGWNDSRMYKKICWQTHFVKNSGTVQETMLLVLVLCLEINQQISQKKFNITVTITIFSTLRVPDYFADNDVM